jgi:type IV secretion system protein TrbF
MNDKVKQNKKDKRDKKSETKMVEQSRYEYAMQAWEDRVGQGKRQLNNWRLCALISFFITLLLIVALVILSSERDPKVYVAQIGPKDQVQSVRLSGTPLLPTEVQKIYFISQFVKNIVSIPLDPVVLRSNWMNSYSMAVGKAQLALTDYVKKNSPFTKVGEITQSVKIERYHSLGQNSYELIWRQKTYNDMGKVMAIRRYSGVFTIEQAPVSNNLQQLLVNPFGLRIIFYSMTTLGSVK